MTEPGDLWTLGSHRLLCGDATDPQDVDRLMGEERAEVLWTDPPYGVDYLGKTADALTIEGDLPQGLEGLLNESFAQASRVLAPGARLYVCHPAGPASATFLGAFAAQGWRLRQTLVWVKDRFVLGHADYHYQHEPILYGHVPAGGRWGRGAKGWYGGNARSSVFEIDRPAASREHPTMKPVELIRRCLADASVIGQVVLDPFAGSGSTLVACEMMGRRGFGVEIDPRYCDVAVDRFEALTGTVPTRQAAA